MNSAEKNNKTENAADLVSRKIALDMLREILDRKNALDVVLERSQEFADLPQRDRAFTRMLITTTLRRLGQIDDLITFAQDRPNTLKTPALHHILRLGVTQMFFMNVPDHASVDTCVRLTEDSGFSKQKGFVNAVLRRLSREGHDRIAKQDASRLNTPDWLLKIWINDYGLQTAGQIALANMSEAALDITVKDKAERAFFGNALTASELSTGTLRRLQGGNIRDLEGFEDGKWWVQDAAAALPATLFGDAKDKKIIDMCAAPGGKTLQLAAMGAHVTAIDRSSKRLKKLKENLVRLDLEEHVHIETADGASWSSKEPVKYILLDAPCSATGTMRRHPDTGYLKSETDITGLQTIQERLLNHSANILSIGGMIIYCTCSLQKAEGEEQIDQFLKMHPNFERNPITPEEVGQYDELINDKGDLRILPFMLSAAGGIDGFFVSRLVKIG
ncbi:MAG: 16S rRNA (cytosine(967)-C(5))-methyltransferase RsmB [Alphaproteobacteria bacterium]